MINLSHSVCAISILFLSFIISSYEAACVPSSFSEFSGGCYLYLPGPADWAAAVMHCDEFGAVLATIDTEELVTGIVNVLSINSSTYFGLYKTEACIGSLCAGKYAWTNVFGQPASTQQYTLNMAPYVLDVYCSSIDIPLLTFCCFLLGGSHHLVSRCISS